jgi:hypothetical protein
MLKTEIDITYAQYKTVVSLSCKGLGRILAQASQERLQRLREKLETWDPQTTRHVFYILDVPLEDGTEYRMPEEVQKLYGKRYLMALNTIKEALTREVAERAFEEMFNDVNA